jgi:Sec-independent protein translocase protein TatA
LFFRRITFDTWTKESMKNSRRAFSIFILIALASVGASVGLSSKVQREPSRVNSRQVGEILRRLTQSSDRFRSSLNNIKHRGREGQQENDVNSLYGDFENAANGLRADSRRTSPNPANVRNVLQKAAPLNELVSRRRFDAQARNAWTPVRSNLAALARAYDISWQWEPQAPSPPSTTGSNRLSAGELDRLIGRIETGGDQFRSSLTDAFDRSRFDRTRGESRMNEAVGGFKNATNQLRNHFDASQSVKSDVQRLLEHATPVDAYMRANKLTERSQSDWSTLRSDLEGLARAYDSVPMWNGSSESQPF